MDDNPVEVPIDQIPPNEGGESESRSDAKLGHWRAWATINSVPPTLKQLAYLRSLGYDGPVDNAGHASELIDRLRKK